MIDMVARSSDGKNMEKSRNPQVIRDLIRDIINEDFNGDVAVAAVKISERGLRMLSKKRDYKGITPSILYSIMRDDSHIKFSHLEIIAGYIGVPTGVLLIYTRCRSAERVGDLDDVEHIRKILTQLNRFIGVKSLEYSEFKRKMGSLEAVCEGTP